jgi:hypothetical protein
MGTVYFRAGEGAVTHRTTEGLAGLTG